MLTWKRTHKRGMGVVYADYHEGVIELRNPLLENYVRTLETVMGNGDAAPANDPNRELLQLLEFMISGAITHELAHHIRMTYHPPSSAPLRRQKPRIIVEEAVATFAENTVLTNIRVADLLLDSYAGREKRKALTDSARLLKKRCQSRDAVTEIFADLGSFLGYSAFLEASKKESGSLAEIMVETLFETSRRKNAMLLASVANQHYSFNEFLLRRRTSCRYIRRMLRQLEPT